MIFIHRTIFIFSHKRLHVIKASIALPVILWTYQFLKGLLTVVIAMYLVSNSHSKIFTFIENLFMAGFHFRVNGIFVVLFGLIFSPTDKLHSTIILRPIHSNSQNMLSNFPLIIRNMLSAKPAHLKPSSVSLFISLFSNRFHSRGDITPAWGVPRVSFTETLLTDVFDIFVVKPYTSICKWWNLLHAFQVHFWQIHMLFCKRLQKYQKCTDSLHDDFSIPPCEHADSYKKVLL